MVAAPDTSYARTSSGDRVAFQAVGDGPVDMLVTHLPTFPVDLMWDEPRLAHVLHRLSAFSRHIWFDHRGTGASDGITRSESGLVESVVDDMIAVIDAAGCERVVLVQFGGPASLLFAATHPERTSALVLFNVSARFRRAEDYPQGFPDDQLEQRLAAMADAGYPSVEFLAPSLAGDLRFRRWFERAARLMCSPNETMWLLRSSFFIDLRGVLDAVQAPTLVMYRTQAAAAAQYGYVADHIPGARRVELEGADPYPFVGDAGVVVDTIEEFVTGRLPAPTPDRVLASVLFTDLVDSTGHAARVGDRHWRELLATHDALVGDELERFRGHAVKFTGDGVLATFDGPARAIRCACAIRDMLEPLGLQMRAGLHTGEIEVRGDDVSGITVHIAQRVASLAGAGEVLVSRTVADLLAGSDITFHDHGEHELKGVPGTWRLFDAPH